MSTALPAPNGAKKVTLSGTVGFSTRLDVDEATEVLVLYFADGPGWFAFSGNEGAALVDADKHPVPANLNWPIVFKGAQSKSGGRHIWVAGSLTSQVLRVFSGLSGD